MLKGRKKPRGTAMEDVVRQMSTITDGASCPNTSNMSMQPQNHLIPESQANFNAQSQPNLLQSKSKSLSQAQYRTNYELKEQNILRVGNNSGTGSKLPVSKKSNPSVEKKGRGPAKLPYKWGSETKVELTLNREGLVIGEKEEYNCYTSALGAYTRIGTLLPLNYTSWSYMPQDKLDQIWKDVQDNTTLTLNAKSAVLHQLNDMWRDWKRRLKANYFTPYKDDPDHDFSELPNEQVELDQWLTLVVYWKQSEVQEQAKKNAESRAKKKYPHRTGKTPIPHLKEKMRYEGVDTTEFDMFIASRSCGQGIDADPETSNLVQEFREGLSKKPETEQIEKFKEDLYVNAFGEDPHGRVRRMGRGITRNKLRNLSSSNTPTTEMNEQIDELQHLKDVLKHDIKEVELLKLELVNQKEEFFKEKERMIAEMRREFGEELDHMKVSLDYFVSLVDSSTLQATLSRVSTRGEKIANYLGGTQEPQINTDENTLSVEQQSLPYLGFPTPREMTAKKNLKTPNQGNKRLPHVVGAGRAGESNEYDYRPVQVGSDVVLFCSEIPKESVAEGVLLSIDPNEKVDEVALGYEYVKVVIRKAIKPDYFLERPPRGVTTIRQAIGKSVAWEYVNVMEK